MLRTHKISAARAGALLALITGALTGISGCVSTDTKMMSFYGKPIQYVILERGEPDAIVDMPHKTRAFQWFQLPDTMASSMIGDKLIGVDMSDECKYTIFAEWDELQDAFIIYDHEDVKFGC